MWDLHAAAGQSLETAVDFRRVPGGAAANVALHLIRLGLPSAVSGVIADDSFGDGLRQSLQHSGVDTSALLRMHGRSGLVFIEHVEPQHERYLSYRPAIERMPTQWQLPAGPGLAVLHLTALNPVVEELKAMLGLAREARARGAWVVVDINARPRPWRKRKPPRVMRSLFAEAHVIKASDGDVRALGYEVKNATEAARALSIDRATLVFTCGGKTASVTGPWGTASRRPPTITPSHSIGAGDAFCARLIADLCELEPFEPFDAKQWRRLLERSHAYAARALR
jgi:sugar/nucleoside kinase (ribokinase family)